MFNTIKTKISALSSDRKSVLTLVGGTTIDPEFPPIFGDGFVNMCNAIKTLTEKYPAVDFVFAMHLNSNVHNPIREIFGEEAPGLGKPVLVMRNTTERLEAVDAGTVKLVGTNYNLIIEEVSILLNDVAYYNSMAQAHNPYGDGLACERIIEFIR